MDAFVQFFGRLHVMLLHAPIGLLFGLVAIEAVAAVRRRPLAPDVRSALSWLVALAALVTAGTGFVLGRSGEFTGDLVDTHRVLGLIAAGTCVLIAVLQQWARAPGVYYGALAVGAGAMILAGHKGGGITHGEGFVLEPFRRAGPDRAVRDGAEPDRGTAASHTDGPSSNPPSQFVRVVRPILEKRCYACHGPSKQKGGLALNTPEGIERGGDFGPVVTPGHPEASEIIRRLRLARDDEDHMPPSSKGQPSPEDIKAIEDWIAAGASVVDAPSAAVAPATASPAETGSGTTPSTSAAETAAKPGQPDAAAVSALRATLAHVAAVSQGSSLLSVDLSVAPGVSEPDAIRLLNPLRANIDDLTVARLPVGDALAAEAARMPALRRLDLTATQVSDEGLRALAASTSIEDLVLVRTRLGGASATLIASIGPLKRVYLWGSGIGPEDVASLRQKRPDVHVDAGDSDASTPVEAETEVKLSSEAPPPGAPAVVAAAADALKPVNTVCPVSGKPVDPAFAIVYKGRVIGFCCQHCPGQFFEDPAKFEDKIK